ncbi:MAG: TetR family transcriptional regulator C-terminal domain-containing protein [Candidatus Eisenbacteria bacterium]|nr:TetR family transcriptional regulator C-terminal domain-containing protein [Candidatus Eisenbacteria bacterium]
MQEKKRRGGRGAVNRDELPSKATKLLEAASRVVCRDGFAALSLDAVDEEAGEYRGSVRYYFRNKAGLIEALVRLIMTEPHLEEKAEEVRRIPPGRERLTRHLQLWEPWAANLDDCQLWAELLPYVSRDPELGAEVLELYDIWRAIDASLLDGDSELSQSDVETIATLIGTVIDGLQLLHVIDKKHDRSADVFRVLGDMIDAYMQSRHQDGGTRP